MQAPTSVRSKMGEKSPISLSHLVYGALDLVWGACKSLKSSQQEACSSYSLTDFSPFLRMDGSIVRGTCKIEIEALLVKCFRDCPASQ
jgi:hypothetical protein